MYDIYSLKDVMYFLYLSNIPNKTICSSLLEGTVLTALFICLFSLYSLLVHKTLVVALETKSARGVSEEKCFFCSCCSQPATVESIFASLLRMQSKDNSMITH